MTTKLVVRVLDDAGGMLGWVEHYAAMLGDGMLRASGVVTVPMDRDGLVHRVTLHWCDLNVLIEPTGTFGMRVKAGDSLAVFQRSEPMVVVGPPAGGLPPVTVRRAAVIAVPIGEIGARA